jgi:hypothetical protein
MKNPIPPLAVLPEFTFPIADWERENRPNAASFCKLGRFFYYFL